MPPIGTTCKCDDANPVLKSDGTCAPKDAAAAAIDGYQFA
jgi:hypothetical protein